MANTDNKNNKKFSLRKLIYNDKYLIVFSIITAVIVWISTSMSLSPETTKKVERVESNHRPTYLFQYADLPLIYFPYKGRKRRNRTSVYPSCIW